MVCKDTLRIKYLPKELTDAQKEDFIRHFGALKVKVITSKAKANSIVYAKFENEDVAKNVMLRLHQIGILNCRLCVEYAETDILQGQLTTQKVDEVRDGPDKNFFKTFINNINAFNDAVGFYQPPPSHLKYNYPKVNRPTINNIAHALATVPRFYTQVLHLMNKMNLPPPFAMPEPPVRTIIAGQSCQSTIAAQNQGRNSEKRQAPTSSSSSSSESELESDGESDKAKEIIPQKRPVTNKKTLKRPKFIKKPVIQPTVSRRVDKATNVFEKVDVQPPKKIEMKVIQNPIMETCQHNEMNIETINETKVSKPEQSSKSPESQQKLDTKEDLALDKTKPVKLETVEMQLNVPEQVKKKSEAITRVELEYVKEPQRESNTSLENESKEQEIAAEVIQPQVDERVQDIEENPETSTEPHLSEDEFPCISSEELSANQITDLSVTPVFKNYKAGDPTNKLYIKNCSKTVVVQDLEYIYNRYREEGTKEKPSEFNIRLMQEGRMKGQAFVTLDSVEQAQRAVKETNGFILKDKPLVVVFGKAGKKK